MDGLNQDTSLSSMSSLTSGYCSVSCSMLIVIIKPWCLFMH
ncbi:Uncharacterised protein [Vibrio cholerae]|nr:Uncharacterised protein [Vibrio cholerae]CSB72347.1 Uncharacterised protein [Vibrio cholerae]CSI74996.1 Uncharacterised protein [Vibrio cholerae]